MLYAISCILAAYLRVGERGVGKRERSRNINRYEKTQNPVPCLSTLILLLAIPSYAQEPPWYEGFYLEGSALYYFTPDVLKELIRPELSYRGAFGYELKNFRFTVESGFSRVVGTNPLVLEIEFIPVVFKFGYALPIIFGFGIQADLGLGAAFSHTTRYETALDMVLGKLREDDERSLITQARLYVTWSPWKFLKFYAGGGGDIIFETKGPIPLPLLEAGISLKPLALAGAIARMSQKRAIAKMNAVYFERNSVTMIESDLPVLDNIGRRMKDNAALNVILVAYYAPEKTAEWQVQRGTGEPALSAARAEWCAQYLTENFGIAPERIKIEYRLAAEKTPELYRGVELLVK